jgi:hypothetical protein
VLSDTVQLLPVQCPEKPRPPRVLVLKHKPALIEYLARQRLAWETFLLAETLGFPWVRLRPGLAIAGDRVGWGTFLCGPPDPEDLLQAYVAVLDGEGLAR